MASSNFTIVNRNDNLGPASDRTGFFVYSKAGELKFQDFTYNVKLSNVIKNINKWIFRSVEIFYPYLYAWIKDFD